MKEKDRYGVDSSGLLCDILTGPVGPFARVIIIVGLIAGAGGNLFAVLDPVDTEDRYKGRDAEKDKREHQAQHQAEKEASIERLIATEDELSARIDGLLAAFNLHLIHSAEYTRVIEDDHKALKEHILDFKTYKDHQ